MQASFARHLYSALMPEASRAHQLTKLRKAAGLSQRELARALDVHYSNVSFWERTGVAPRGELAQFLHHFAVRRVEHALNLPARRKRIGGR